MYLILAMQSRSRKRERRLHSPVTIAAYLLRKHAVFPRATRGSGNDFPSPHGSAAEQRLRQRSPHLRAATGACSFFAAFSHACAPAHLFQPTNCAFKLTSRHFGWLLLLA